MMSLYFSLLKHCHLPFLACCRLRVQSVLHQSPLDATLAEFLDGACGSTSSDFNLTHSTRNFDHVLSQFMSDKSPPSLFSGIGAHTTTSEVSLPDQVTSVSMTSVSKPVYTSAGCPSSMYNPTLVSVSGSSAREGTSVPYTPTPLAALSESQVSVALVTTVESSTRISSTSACTTPPALDSLRLCSQASQPFTSSATSMTYSGLSDVRWHRCLPSSSCLPLTIAC